MQPDQAYALYEQGTRIIRHERLRRAARTRRAAYAVQPNDPVLMAIEVPQQYRELWTETETVADRITTHVSRYSPEEGGWLLVVVGICLATCAAMVVGAAAAAFCKAVGF